MSTITRRVARTALHCSSHIVRGLHAILPGEAYLEGVYYPGEDGMEGYAKPHRFLECGKCAETAGRGGHLQPHIIDPTMVNPEPFPGGPRRIQRRRAKGWRMPEGAIYVGRPTRWGNPYRYRTHTGMVRVPALDGSPWEYEGRIKAEGMSHPFCHPDGHFTHHHVRYATMGELVTLYEAEVRGRSKWSRLPTVTEIRQALAGKDLACWCPTTSPCHADVLLRIANQPEEDTL
jgi:hypothetical protein